MRNIYKHLHSEVVFIFQCIYTDKLNYVALARPRQVLSYDPPQLKPRGFPPSASGALISTSLHFPAWEAVHAPHFAPSQSIKAHYNHVTEE